MKINLARRLLIVIVMAGAALAAIACSPQPAVIAAGTDSSGAPALAATPTPGAALTPTPEARGNAPQNAGRNRNDLLARADVVLGVVSQNAADSLTLKTRDGSQTIAFDANTLIVIPGQINSKTTDIKNGDRVLVKKDNADKATADLVLVAPADFKPDNVMLGRVESLASGSLTFKAKKGSQTLTTTATTLVVNVTAGKATLGSLSDVQSGAMALVVRDANSNAQVVITLGKRGANAGKNGRGAP